MFCHPIVCWDLGIYKWSLIYTVDIIRDAFLVRNEVTALFFWTEDFSSTPLHKNGSLFYLALVRHPREVLIWEWVGRQMPTPTRLENTAVLVGDKTESS
jgi:hypothetical protein